MHILLKWLINALALLLVAYLVPGIDVAGFYVALILALVLGLLNVFLRPLLILLTLPITIVTLGFFSLIINGLLFWLASTIVEGFDVSGFLSAFLGALLFSIIHHIGERVFLPKKEE